MNTTLKVLFLLRTPKNYTSGVVPVYMRITIDSHRFEVATQREVDPEKWDSKSGRIVRSKNESTRALNAFFDLLQARVYDAQSKLLNNGDLVTAENIRNILLHKRENKTLLQVYNQHIEEIKALVGKEYAEGTLRRFKSTLAALKAYLTHNGKSDILLRDLNHPFITGYEFFLKSVRNIEHNTAMGTIKKLKKIVRICVANDWIDKDPFMNYRIKIRETNRPFLVQDELNRILKLKTLTERLSRVRDIFVFSCYTGLSYADVQKLNRQDIVHGDDGETWIHTRRIKTHTATRVPLLPQAIKIIDAYKDHPQCVTKGRLLPVMSNQKMNEYLKEIAERCDINKKMTFHTARHTFATTVTLTNGVPIETVSKMLGHKDLKTTQQYAKIIDQKVSEDMKQLRNKMMQQNAAAVEISNECMKT